MKSQTHSEWIETSNRMIATSFALQKNEITYAHSIHQMAFQTEGHYASISNDIFAKVNFSRALSEMALA